MAGPAQSVRMPKVRNPHLLPIAHENEEDISFDIYQRARDLMELSGHKMLPEQDPPKKGLHLWTLKRTANAVSNGVSIREYACSLPL